MNPLAQIGMPIGVAVASAVLALIGALTPLVLPARRIAFLLLSVTTLSLFLVTGPWALAITLPPAALVVAARLALRRRRRPTLQLAVNIASLTVGIVCGEVASRLVGADRRASLSSIVELVRTVFLLGVAYSVFVTTKELVSRALFGLPAMAPSKLDVLERALPLYAFGALVLGPVLLLSRAVYSEEHGVAYIAILCCAAMAHVALPIEVRRVLEVRALIEAQERKARLDAVAAPSTRIAHHLRHHVALIGLSLDRIDDRLGALGIDEPIVRDELERLALTRDELRELLADDSSIRTLPPARDWRGILESSLEQIRGLADERGVSVSADFEALPGDAPRSSRKVSQAFFNLVENAVSAASSEVRIEASAEPGFVVVAVVDDGPGMSDEVFRRATDPFFTTKAGGTGMGLAIARAVAEELGGELVLERPARGVRATLRFSRAPRYA